MDDDLGTVWELYGLKANPFSTNPLLIKGGIIPLDCFYGREEELGRIMKHFRFSGGTRMLVVGEPGVGKTTLANFARAKAIEKNFFSPFQEIKVQPTWNTDDLIMNTLGAICATLKLLDDKHNTKKLVERLKKLVDVYEMKDRTGSVSVVGSGIGYGETRTMHKPVVTSTFILNEFENTVTALREIGYREIIIHYNNFEMLEENPDKLKSFLNGIRDYLQTPYVHFIFVGSPDLSSTVQSISRVSSIFSDTPIKINPLSKDEILSIIDKRIEVLKIPNLNVEKPYTKETVLMLYRLYEGNMRAIFNSLSTAVMENVKDTPITFDEKTLRIVLSSLAKKRYTDRLPPTLQKVLRTMLELGESTNAVLSKKTGIKRQNMSKYIKELDETGCIYLIRTEKTNKFYAVADWVKWLALE